MTNTVELKPCPMCDDDAELEHNASEATIRCMGCGLSIHRSYNPLIVKSYEAGREREKRDVINAWNARRDTTIQEAAKVLLESDEVAEELSNTPDSRYVLEYIARSQAKESADG